METGQLSYIQKELIEELGVVLEKTNNIPVVARIFALLIVSDQPELTFDQIRELLNISKSATSNAIKILLMTNAIEYITKPQDRKRYFRSYFGHWNERVKKDLGYLTDVVAVLKKIAMQRPSNTVEVNQNLKKSIRFMEFIISEVPNLYKKWELLNQ